MKSLAKNLIGLAILLIDFALIVSGIVCLVINNFVEQYTALSNFLYTYGWCGIGVSIGSALTSLGASLLFCDSN